MATSVEQWRPHLLGTRCCSSSPTGRSRPCRRSPAPAPWRRTLTPAARPPPGEACRVSATVALWPANNTQGWATSDLVEASDQALRLLHHPPLDPPLHHALDVLLLVLLRDRDVGSTRLQLSLCYLQKKTTHIYKWKPWSTQREDLRYGERKPTNLSEDLFVDGEREVKHVFNVVVLHPLQRLVELLIQIFQVAQITRTAARVSGVFKRPVWKICIDLWFQYW